MKKYLQWNGQILGRGGRYFTPGVRIRPNYIYGLLYNWYAASDERIGNSGFTVPTNAEWTSMINYVDTTYNVAPNDFGVGNHLKSCRQVNSPLGGDCDTSIHPRWNSNATHWGRDTLKLGLSAVSERNVNTGFTSVGSGAKYMTLTPAVGTNFFEIRLTVGTAGVGIGTPPRATGVLVRLFRLATPAELLIPEGQIIPNYYKGNNNFLYDCVRINDRIWLAQNLAETKWSDGTDIPFAGSNGVNFSNAEWAALTTPGVCAYNNDVYTWGYRYPEDLTIWDENTGGIFNGLEYQVVTSPYTGRIWMDRNLGATRVATAVNDAPAYGDLFQFRKPDDGHQNRDSETTTEISTSITPINNKFFIGTLRWCDGDYPGWDDVARTNLPAPKGWRMPTFAEFHSEVQAMINEGTTMNTQAIFDSFFKMPTAGARNYLNGVINTTVIRVWSTDNRFDGSSRRCAYFTSSSYNSAIRTFWTEGCTIRLIKEI